MDKRLIFLVIVLVTDYGRSLTSAHSIIRTGDDSTVSTISFATNSVNRMELEASKHYQCPVHMFSPDRNSDISLESVCPFDFVVDTDPNRIPETIIEQVCRGCQSCGPQHSCIQLTIVNDIYYRDTNENSRLQLRAGCICMPN